MKKEIKKYWLNPRINFKTYKLLHDKTAQKDSGPTPKNFNRILWEMLKERKLNIYITNKSVLGENWFPTTKKIPRGATIISTLLI